MMNDLLRPQTHTPPKPAQAAASLDLTRAPENPLRLLGDWVAHILSIAAVEPMYVTLATSSGAGVVSSRTVQMLDVEADTILFTTNFGSRKGTEMAETGRAAVSIYWRETAQSVNFTGTVAVADDAENDLRFAQDPRWVQASRAVSFQGRPLPDEAAQLAAFRALAEGHDPIARPPYWKWYRIRPDAMTFWEGHSNALNRRIHYALGGGVWSKGMVQS
ncbi:pyridoxamine 5'-phosphate oxidase [Ketogulonicigenium robustum]|uniref:Pyridoxamine 5'-phosphate oxidase n=1 Tax=Ketogulonicigenium robustum TaxID=92947 RepID=A0A1W6NZV1_9RHOB|nr:pyridoxamine 5'-phosphate oxidase family protein [Ketogulonicigenium robustum]ARO14734.1 pyridoxamine 5'-phosphate oxidase [Ketogulonicigenium robustum]